MRLRISAVIAILLASCTSRELPPSHASPDEGPPPGGESPLESDFVRTELREIHGLCDARVSGLETSVDDAAQREDIARAIAVGAYAVGELADGSGDAEVMGRTGAGARGCAETPNDIGCGVTPVPSAGAGAESPIHQDTVDARLSASDRIRDINRALDALDDFVFQKPDPATWTDDDRGAWETLRQSARSECEREDSHARRGPPPRPGPVQ